MDSLGGLPFIEAIYRVYLLICSSAALILLPIIFYEKASILTGYSSPVTALMATSIFIVTKGFGSKHSTNLWTFDRLCFGVYLVHPVFTNLTYKFLHITPLMFGRFLVIGIIVFFLAFTMLGFLTSWIMNKIPVLKRYVL